MRLHLKDTQLTVLSAGFAVYKVQAAGQALQIELGGECNIAVLNKQTSLYIAYGNGTEQGTGFSGQGYKISGGIGICLQTGNACFVQANGIYGKTGGSIGTAILCYLYGKLAVE